MLKLLVIADDFTGALDTGVQFSSQGIQTMVSTQTAIDYDRLPPSLEVLVIDAESRHLSQSQAYARIKAILSDAITAEIPYIYKKVDSALRGNISSEIKAVVDSFAQPVIPFLPAYPEMNRTVVGGHLYIDQVLVSESVFAADPYEPVRESNILQRLETEAGLSTVLVQEEEIDPTRAAVHVFDAQTDEMLLQQAEKLQAANLLGVTIGCAGFAKVLAKQLFTDRKKVQYTIEQPLVVICGSVNPITQAQVNHAQQQYPRISLSAHQLLTEGYWDSPQGKQDQQAYSRLMETYPLIVFETFSEQTSKELPKVSEANNLSLSDSRFQIGIALGKLTEALWTAHQENTFLFTGGDTLFQSMEVLGINGIIPLAELQPGIVLSLIEWNNRKMKVITKSGGFGSETLFEELIMTHTSLEEDLLC